ncbi:hypothetical protein TNCV_665321 [Trichonephila clavipes]|uniref:Uncharacterized protein n=1 Tax=Trichonephila clavipes TaxID=2585209 RepID=A0A8X6SR68_TRICX|nr:hypothetical protein TNCV_665321 [Trichonephila clavipes]
MLAWSSTIYHHYSNSKKEAVGQADLRYRFVPIALVWLYSFNPKKQIIETVIPRISAIAPIIADKDILKFVQCSKNVIDADYDDENEMNNAAPVPTSSEMRNIMKSMRNYLDAHSNGEMNIEMNDIEHFVVNWMLKKDNTKKNTRSFSKS